MLKSVEVERGHLLVEAAKADERSEEISSRASKDYAAAARGSHTACKGLVRDSRILEASLGICPGDWRLTSSEVQRWLAVSRTRSLSLVTPS